MARRPPRRRRAAATAAAAAALFLSSIAAVRAEDEDGGEEDGESGGGAGGVSEIPESRRCAACTYVHRKLQDEYSRLIYAKGTHRERTEKAAEKWCSGIRFVSFERNTSADADDDAVLRYGKKKQLLKSGAKEAAVVSGVEIDRELAEYCETYKAKNSEAAQNGFLKLGHLGKAKDYDIIGELCRDGVSCAKPEEVEEGGDGTAAGDDDVADGEPPSDDELAGWRNRRLRRFLEAEGIDPKEVGTDKADLLAAARAAAAARREAAASGAPAIPPFTPTGWYPDKQCAVCRFVHRALQTDYAKRAYSKEKRPVKVRKAMKAWCTRGMKGVVRLTAADGEVLAYGYNAEKLRAAAGADGEEAAATDGGEVDEEAAMYCYEYKRRGEEKAEQGFRKVEKAGDYDIVRDLCGAKCAGEDAAGGGATGAERKARWKEKRRKQRAAREAAGEAVPTDDEIRAMRAGKLRDFLASAGVDAAQVGTDKSDLLREALRIAEARRGGGEL